MKKILVSLTVLGLLAFTAVPALAWGRSDSDIEVENDNWADVTNNVTVGAYTGMNTTNGGDGDDGGDSEATAIHGGGVSSGNAGAGGDGGDGGNITSGDAYAGARVTNVVNTNYTKIKSRCSRHCNGDIEVENDDSDAVLDNTVDVLADTGLNMTNGGDGDDGGDSEATAIHGGGVDSGNAGAGGDGGDGGNISSGDAYAGARVFNMVNTNITRIRR